MYPSLIYCQTSPRCPLLVNRFVSYEKLFQISGEVLYQKPMNIFKGGHYQYNVQEMLSVRHFICRTDSIEMPIA